MEKKDIFCVIMAINLDRNANAITLRGSLDFFGKPIIKIMNDELKKSNADKQLIYTTSKGIIFKNILDKNTAYIIKKSNYIYGNNTINIDLLNLFQLTNNLLIIDAKYPLLDKEIINKLIKEHLQQNADLSLIKYIFEGKCFIPDIIIVNEKTFKQLFSIKRQIKDNFKLITDSVKINYCEIKQNYKLLPFIHKKSIDLIESMLVKGK